MFNPLHFVYFSYEGFTGRTLLAVLDHNFHLFRKEIQGMFKKKYSKRSGNWSTEPVKEEKSYGYWPVLLSEILKKRAEDKESASRPVEVAPTNPKHLAATTAMKEAPLTKELVETKCPCFKKYNSKSFKALHRLGI